MSESEWELLYFTSPFFYFTMKALGSRRLSESLLSELISVPFKYMEAVVPPSVPPKDSFSAYVPVPHTVDLDRLLCVCIPRSLSVGSTISIKNRNFQIEQTHFRGKTKATILLSEKHVLRVLINDAFYPIHYLEHSGQPIVSGQKHDQLPDVVQLLINDFLLKDAKAA